MTEHEPTAPHVAAVRELALGEAVGGPMAIPPKTRSERARRVVAYVLMVLLALLYLVPLLWSAVTSLKTQAEAAAGFDLWPANPSLDAYRDIWNREDLSFVNFFKNSLILATSITAINVFLATLGGYAFARLRFPLREVLFILVLGTLMIPDQLRLVPVYLMMVDFPVTGTNLTGTKEGYVFFGTSIALATNLFLMRQYFLTIPRDYEEAAKLDGAGYFKTYARVMLPLAAPAVAAVAILTFQGIWNEFFWANLLLGSAESSADWTVQMGLVQFRFQYQTLWPQLMAAATLAILPVLIVYIFFQRYFVAGVAAAGVKG
jgi:multiple sugar transport system permease protein